MSFYHRYELVKLVNNGDPKSFEAREIQTGQAVLLHLWSMSGDAAASPLLLRLRSLMSGQPAIAAGRLIEVQETAQPPYAVTAVEPGFTSLDAWLDSLGQAAAYAPPVPPPPAPRPVDTTVEMPFVSSPPAPPTPVFEPVVPPPAPAAPAPFVPPAAPAAQPEAGEFTRMFQGSIAPPASHQPVAAPPPAPPAAPELFAQQPAPAEPAREMGEFTRLFASPGGSTPPPSPAPPAAFGQPAPATKEPGEFTRLFASPTPSTPPPAPPAPAAAVPPPPSAPPDFFAQPAAPPPAPAANAGFDALFGGPVQQPSSPPIGMPQAAPSYGAPPPAPKPQESEFDKFFASPFGAGDMPIEAIEQGKMASPQAPSAKPFRGAGDFTLQFGRDAVQPPPAPDINYAPPSAPTPQARMASGATGVFSAPQPNYGADLGGPIAPSGPGEFTRIIQGPPREGSSSPSATPQYSAPPPSAVAAPAPQQKSKMMPIFIGVLSVVVIALVIVLIVVMLKK